jgi:hypothetical protein
MDSNYLLSLTSISQWTLFAGIAAALFGWVEKRDKVELAGQIIFILSGIMAIWVIFTKQIIVPETFGPEISKPAKALTYFNGVALLSGVATVSIILKLFKVRFYKIALTITIGFALLLFFLVFNLQKMA